MTTGAVDRVWQKVKEAEAQENERERQRQLNHDAATAKRSIETDRREFGEKRRYFALCQQGDTEYVDDAVRFDAEASCKLLADLAAMNRGDITDETFRKYFRIVMRELYAVVSQDHARKCRENGWPK